jgi:hypothetical protein
MTYMVEVWHNYGSGHAWVCVAANQSERAACGLATYWASGRGLKSRVRPDLSESVRAEIGERP